MRLLGGRQKRVLSPFLLPPLGRGCSEPVTELVTLSLDCFNSGKRGKILNQTSSLWLVYTFFEIFGKISHVILWLHKYGWMDDLCIEDEDQKRNAEHVGAS